MIERLLDHNQQCVVNMLTIRAVLIMSIFGSISGFVTVRSIHVVSPSGLPPVSRGII